MVLNYPNLVLLFFGIVGFAFSKPFKVLELLFLESLVPILLASKTGFAASIFFVTY
jgi:hypothetical protein